MTGDLAFPKPGRTLPAERRRIRAISSRERAALIRKATRLARALVLRRAGGRCEACGEKKPLDCAHGWSKGSHPRVRFHGANLGRATSTSARTGAGGLRSWGTYSAPFKERELRALSSFPDRTDLRATVAALSAGRFLEDR